jgi:hypothetical protein
LFGVAGRASLNRCFLLNVLGRFVLVVFMARKPRVEFKENPVSGRGCLEANRPDDELSEPIFSPVVLCPKCNGDFKCDESIPSIFSFGHPRPASDS